MKTFDEQDPSTWQIDLIPAGYEIRTVSPTTREQHLFSPDGRDLSGRYMLTTYDNGLEVGYSVVDSYTNECVSVRFGSPICYTREQAEIVAHDWNEGKFGKRPTPLETERQRVRHLLSDPAFTASTPGFTATDIDEYFQSLGEHADSWEGLTDGGIRWDFVHYTFNVKPHMDEQED